MRIYPFYFEGPFVVLFLKFDFFLGYTIIRDNFAMSGLWQFLGYVVYFFDLPSHVFFLIYLAMSGTFFFLSCGQ